MLEIMARYKKHVEVIPVDYKYSFGNQGEAKTHRNSVQEYIEQMRAFLTSSLKITSGEISAKEQQGRAQAK